MISVQQEGKRLMRRPRSVLVRTWLSEERIQQLGYMPTLITRELRAEDVNAFQNFLRMPPKLFDGFLKDYHQSLCHHLSRDI